MHHKPVLLKESISFLITKPDGVYFDGTLGFAGHSSVILNSINNNGTLIATDVDNDAFDFSIKKIGNDPRVNLYKFNFTAVSSIAKIEKVSGFDGIFADLGVSSFQLDNPVSGFTYRNDALLDLRMDKSKVVNASDIVNTFSEEDLAEIFYRFGEEKNSRKIAKNIIDFRKQFSIKTTSQLAGIIEKITPQRFYIKTLSRVFQALRIYVNDELGSLKTFLSRSVQLLNKGGRIVILTYHSLEDRIVKEFFKYESINCICPKGTPVCICGKEQRLNILTKKPVVPTEEELIENYRSRSAKLRAAEKK